jgi:hypothetical protein
MEHGGFGIPFVLNVRGRHLVNVMNVWKLQRA